MGSLGLVRLVAAAAAALSLSGARTPAGHAPSALAPALALRDACADGQREAFLDAKRYPDIAGCSGGFDRPGLYFDSGATCGRRGGDDGALPAGAACSIGDLCAEGFHVCRGAADVAAHSPDGCVGAHDAQGEQFFASRQSGPGCAQCAIGGEVGCDGNSCREGCAPTPATTNDMFGCGTAGVAPWGACGVLDRFSNDQCGSLPAPWSCAGTGTDEAIVVTKPGPLAGGALCCRD